MGCGTPNETSAESHPVAAGSEQELDEQPREDALMGAPLDMHVDKEDAGTRRASREMGSAQQVSSSQKMPLTASKPIRASHTTTEHPVPLHPGKQAADGKDSHPRYMQSRWVLCLVPAGQSKMRVRKNQLQKRIVKGQWTRIPCTFPPGVRQEDRGSYAVPQQDLKDLQPNARGDWR